MTLEPDEAVESADVDVPDWIPEKFRQDPSQLARSYTELEAKLTQTSQLLREQEEQFEAFLASQDEHEQLAVEHEPPQSQGRQQELVRLQRIAEASAFAGAKRVVGALRSGRVPAPADPELLAKVASQVMPQRDPRWSETDVDLLAAVVAEKPELINDLADLNSVVSGLSNAAEIARGRQSERAMQAWSRAEEMRQTKRNAQTISGAGSRIDAGDDDDQFFDRLKAAAGQNWSNRQSS